MTPIKSLFKNSFKNWVIKKRTNSFVKGDLSLLKKTAGTTLTKDEEAAIDKVWSLPDVKVNYSYHKFYKAIEGFNPQYLPVDVYYPYILRSLNPENQSYVFANKGLYTVLYPNLAQPKCIVRNIDDVFFDSQMNIVSKDKAIELVEDHFERHEDLIIKPVADSGFGKNVKKVSLPKVADKKKDLIYNLFTEFRSNFVVQEFLLQHKDTAVFNPESLNTCRVTSLFLNGKVSILSSIFRFGQEGATVDNGYAGGVMIGIKNDGSFNDYGYDINLKKYTHSSNGIELKGKRIPNYDQLIELVLKNHPKIPTCHLIGWDLAIDSNGKPVLIEVNIKGPGITMEQACTGPIFRNRTDEVLDYVKRNPAKLTHKLN